MTNLMHLPEFDACPVHPACGPRALDASKFSARALDLSYFTRTRALEKVNGHLLTSKQHIEYIVRGPLDFLK